MDVKPLKRERVLFSTIQQNIRGIT